MSDNKPRGRPPKVLKDQVFALDREGWTQSEIARRFEVTPAAIGKILKARDDAGHATVQPVAHDDLELVPVQVRPRVLAQAPPPSVPTVPLTPTVGPGSEWRGVQLGQSLRERFLQLRVMHGPESALSFAQREAWTLHRQGVSTEAISQQFDLPTEDVQALLDKARANALERINSFDPRVSLATALADIEAARHAALRALNSPNSGEHRRERARESLVRIAAAETALAAEIAAYRNAAKLDGDDADDPRARMFAAWEEMQRKEQQT